tara:strand:- start:1817 stop:2215 length:399 start_codon:yes stop_codon:yes gene_type:complete
MDRNVEDTLAEIRKNLREERKKKGITQTKISGLIGVSRPFYNQIESGRRKLSLGRLIQISIILGVSLSALTRKRTIVFDEPEEGPPPSIKKEDTDVTEGTEPRRKGYTEEAPTNPAVRCGNHAMWTYHTDPA